MDLPGFILARITEDEMVARAAFVWQGADPANRWASEGAGRVIDGEGGTLAGYVGDDVAPHIARWDPVRVLAECEAKRAIVETHGLVDAHIRQIALSDPDEARDARSTRAGLQVAMQALALPYAEHPDYDEAWRP